jgi:peptide/nickel transport system substrate-binding protein
MALRFARTVLAGLLAALAFGAPAAGAPETGAVRIGILQQPNTLNPLLGTQAYENYIMVGVFSALTLFNDRGELTPDLATVVPSTKNGGISADGKTVTFHLRRGVLWQDGVPLTARDVRFTFKKMRDPSVPFSNLSDYDDIDRVEAPDDLTVVLKLKHPSADLLRQVFVGGQFGSIVPEHVLANVADMRTAAFNAMPIGSGPYRVERWDRGSQIVLRANPNYFRGRPAIGEIRVRIFPDTNTLALALRTGEIDLCPDLNAGALPLVAGLSGVRVFSRTSTIGWLLYFQTQAAPFDDVRVRQAFALATDRAQLLQNALHGRGIVADDILPPSLPEYTAHAFDTKVDLLRAARLLDAAGWTMGSDGVRSKGAAPLAVTLTTSAESSAARAAAVNLQAMWHRIGVDVSLAPRPINMINDSSGFVAQGRFMVRLGSFGFANVPDRSELITSHALPPHGFNDSRYSNPRLDALVSAGQTTLDEARRKTIYAQISKILAEDLPLAPLVWASVNYVVSDRIEHFKAEPINSDLWNAYEWTLK